MTSKLVQRKIMWGDLDSLGIVFYPRYFEWIDSSSHLFFDAIGLNIGRIWHERDIQFGLAETSSRYHRPGRYHDLIEIETSIDELGSKTVVLMHSIRRHEDQSVLVEAMEKRICLDVSDPRSFRAIVIPEDILQVLHEAADRE
jgi:YbgC/YbaW family acyl-CoA thioester hydrolase